MLKVCEIFTGIQGETTFSGRPCAFIRLAGCNLHCSWCDTEYARTGGEAMTDGEIAARVADGPRLVCVTGGEPLMQKETPRLITVLIGRGHDVLLETNGSFRIDGIDRRAFCMLDLKAPSSGETDRMVWENLQLLSSGDEVIIAIADREDFSWAVKIIGSHPELAQVPVNLTPVAGACSARELAEWILAEGLDVRLNLQLHKLIWPDEERGR